MTDAPQGEKPSVSWRSMLRTVRAPFSALVIAAIALVVPPQTQDMLAALSDGELGHRDFNLLFHLTLAFLAINAWFWARALLNARFDVADTLAARILLTQQDRRVDRRAFDLLPRLLLVLGALLGAGLIGRSRQWLHLFDLLVWSLPLLVAVHFRLPLGERLRPRSRQGLKGPGLPSRAEARLFVREIPSRLDLLLRRAPFSRRWLPAGLLVVSLGMFVYGAIESFAAWPATHQALPALGAAIFPGPCVALVAIALMIGPLSALTFVVDGWRIPSGVAAVGPRRVPLITALLVWVLLAPTIFSIHTVRIVSHQQPDWPVRDRRDLMDFFRAWVRDCAPSSGPVRPIIVAVSGGASRAAIWGARVLSDVERASPPGGPTVFAVSSVSGGSLGTAAYLALLAALAPGQRCAGGPAPQRPEQLTLLGASDLAQDALGPLLAGAMLVDLPRAILSPFAAVVRLSTGRQPHGGDRAEAFERGLERLWRVASRPDMKPGPMRTDFGAPFLSLFYDANGIRPGMPIWIANGTDVATGSRLITAPFSPRGAWPLEAATDALAVLDADVPISTAINNTARFAYLEPSGELLRDEPSGEDRSNGHPHPALDEEIIDGGYFENEGLEAALELAQWLRTVGPGLIADHRTVEPIIVQATADGVAVEPVVRCGSPPDDPAELTGTQRPLQLLAPALGLLAVRGGHSAVLLRQARDRFCAPQQSTQAFFHFYLPARPDGAEVPLNWILSDTTAAFIWNAMDQDADNRAEHDRLTRDFHRP
jgi:hypothetical protein